MNKINNNNYKSKILTKINKKIIIFVKKNKINSKLWNKIAFKS